MEGLKRQLWETLNLDLLTGSHNIPIHFKGAREIMSNTIAQELAELQQMSVGELQTKYVEVFGETTNGRHRTWLQKRIAWRIQANASGGLSDRARERATQLVNESDLRVTAPPPQSEPSPANPTGKNNGGRLRNSSPKAKPANSFLAR